tara:strand:- start:566 stop:811 length:246 start_codon:yes stop_codon:yes gene_type:complete
MCLWHGQGDGHEIRIGLELFREIMMEDCAAADDDEVQPIVQRFLAGGACRQLAGRAEAAVSARQVGKLAEQAARLVSFVHR